MSTRLLFATDLHGHRKAYTELFALAGQGDIDALVLGGDLLPLPLGQGKDLVGIQRSFITDFLRPALRDLQAVHPIPVFGVLGNDDWAACVDLIEKLEDDGLFTNLHMRSFDLDERYRIAGYSCVPLTPFRMSDWDRWDTAAWIPAREPKRLLLSDTGTLREGTLRDIRERATIEEDLRELGRATEPARTIFVCHTPPHDTLLDRMHGDTPIGSHALRAFIEEHQPPLTLHGHVHESPHISGHIEDRLGSTLCINPGDSRTRLRSVQIDLEPAPALVAASD